MSYYEKNKGQSLRKTYDKYHNKGGKQKAKYYYLANKEKIKKRERDRCNDMQLKKKRRKYKNH